MLTRDLILGYLSRFVRLGSWLRLLILCVLAGIAAGLASVVVDRALFYGQKWVYAAYLEHAGTGRLGDLALLIVIPGVGLFLAGLLAWRWAPEVCGGGVDAVIHAFHRGQGLIRPRAAVLKGLCTVLTISAGGSAGKEGPTAQIGASVASALGRLMRLSVHDRRILMLAGCSAGLGAILRAPLGGALFSAEMLYREPDFEHNAVIPGVISSVTAYSVFTALLGFEPVLSFSVAGQPITPHFPTPDGYMFGELVHYALLSLFCAVVAFLLVKGLRLVRTRVFGSLKLAAPLKPLLGGLLLGGFTAAAVLLLYMQPSYVMADGKSCVQAVIEHVLNPAPGAETLTRFTLLALALIILGKIAATALTIGSGASGGLLFPTLFIGAMTGAFYSELWRDVSPPAWLDLNPEARAAMILVAMGGVFAGCTKTPIASLVLVSEMTGSYALAVPLMLCCASTYLLTTSFTLEEEQVPGMADSPAHRGDFLINVLEDIRVAAAIAGRPKPDLIRADTPFTQVLERIKSSSATTFPIVDEHDCLVGVFALSDTRQIMNEQAVGSLLVAGDLGTTRVVTVTPETRLSQALTLFTEYNVNVLPVVEAASVAAARPALSTRALRPRGPVGSSRVIGLLSRHDLIDAYRKRLLELQAAGGQEDKGGRVFEEAQQAVVDSPTPHPEPTPAAPTPTPVSQAASDAKLLEDPVDSAPPSPADSSAAESKRGPAPAAPPPPTKESTKSSVRDVPPHRSASDDDCPRGP